jgi:hypothetical protein
MANSAPPLLQIRYVSARFFFGFEVISDNGRLPSFSTLSSSICQSLALICVKAQIELAL